MRGTKKKKREKSWSSTKLDTTTSISIIFDFFRSREKILQGDVPDLPIKNFFFFWLFRPNRTPDKTIRTNKPGTDEFICCIFFHHSIDKSLESPFSDGFDGISLACDICMDAWHLSPSHDFCYQTRMSDMEKLRQT